MSYLYENRDVSCVAALTRQRLSISWEAIYTAAAKLEALRTYREKHSKKAGAR